MAWMQKPKLLSAVFLGYGKEEKSNLTKVIGSGGIRLRIDDSRPKGKTGKPTIHTSAESRSELLKLISLATPFRPKNLL